MDKENHLKYKTQNDIDLFDPQLICYLQTLLNLINQGKYDKLFKLDYQKFKTSLTDKSTPP